MSYVVSWCSKNKNVDSIRQQWLGAAASLQQPTNNKVYYNNYIWQCYNGFGEVICTLLLYMCCYCHCIECYTFRMYNNSICKIVLITILPLRICQSYVSVHVRECVYVCTCPRVQTWAQQCWCGYLKLWSCPHWVCRAEIWTVAHAEHRMYMH